MKCSGTDPLREGPPGPACAKTKSHWLALAAILSLVLCPARAQDERRVVSPDGRLEFRLFISQPESGGLSRLAYQVFYAGQPVVKTSFLGLDIHNQEPLLGENVGLIASTNPPSSGAWRGLLAEYMQNGSIGRRINVEVRVWNDHLAFRYIIPRSTALDEILIDDEETDFDLVQPVHITEEPLDGFPRMFLTHGEGGILYARLDHKPGARIAFDGATPLTLPWRVLTLRPQQR